jgi:N-acetylglucosamine malate deacetylase 1
MAGQRVLVIAPHCLDEALGCGGAIARHADAGDRVEVLVPFGDGTGVDAARRQAASTAAGILGVAALHFLGLPEGRGDTIPLIDIVLQIERRLGEFQPETLYVPFGGLHVDHQTAFRAGVTAARPLPGRSLRAVYAMEILSSTEWAPAGIADAFRPTRFVDIAGTLERKMQALAAYGAEMRAKPHSRSLESVRALAALRGVSVGLGAAEAFEVVRQVVVSHDAR